MTRKEFLGAYNIGHRDGKAGDYFPNDYDDIFDINQEPCEDCISRAELLKAIDTWDKFGCGANTKLVPYKDHYVPYIHYDDVIKCIKGMPSVNPLEPILDKIIEEISSLAITGRGEDCIRTMAELQSFKITVLLIIAKYRQEV